MSLTGNVTADKLLRGKINGLEKIRGYSAYEIALINGFKGTEEEWLDSLNGGLVTVDKQLYRSGHAADAKVTGERFSAMDDEISVERSRINVIANLPEGSTTGDAELADIRIAHNGREYANAGESVRGQFNEIENGYAKLTNQDFVQGSCGVGGFTTSSITLRPRSALKVKKDDVVAFSGLNGLYWCCRLFTDSNLSALLSESYWLNKDSYTIPQDGFLVILLVNAAGYNDRTTIVPTDFTGEIRLPIHNRINNMDASIVSLRGAVNGYTSENFEVGGFSVASGKYNTETRIRLKYAIKAKKGDVLSFEGLGNCYYIAALLADDNLTAPTPINDSGTWGQGETFEAAEDGYFYVYFANSASYANQTNIAPEDFTGRIRHHKYDPRIEKLMEIPFPVDTEKVKLFAAHYTGENNFEPFLFFTDPHLAQGTGWESEFASYIDCLKRYYNSAPVYNIFCGGDWLGNSDTADEACWKLGYINAQMRSITDNFHLVVGNHDTNEQGELPLTNDMISNLWHRSHGKPYYSFDAAKTRFFILNSGMEDYTEDTNQLDWFANALMSNNADNIALFFHIVRGSGNGNVQPFANTITTIAKAFNDRTTTTINGITYNFVNANGKVRFAMAGHRHEDWNGVVNGIPVVETTQMRTGGVPTFDLCFADYFNGVLNMIRIGTGENRTIEI